MTSGDLQSWSEGMGEKRTWFRSGSTLLTRQNYHQGPQQLLVKTDPFWCIDV